MNSIHIIRTDSSNPNFIQLVHKLDDELAILDGDDHAFYDQFNKIDRIQHAIVLKNGELAVACGAFKAYDEETVEIKRMYTLESHRGQHLAAQLLDELEKWASSLDYKRTVLETGLKQKAAIRLYERCGYHRIPNYGQYADIENSLCFEKHIS